MLSSWIQLIYRIVLYFPINMSGKTNILFLQRKKKKRINSWHYSLTITYNSIFKIINYFLKAYRLFCSYVFLVLWYFIILPLFSHYLFFHMIVKTFSKYNIFLPKVFSKLVRLQAVVIEIIFITPTVGRCDEKNCILYTHIFKFSSIEWFHWSVHGKLLYNI